MDRKYSKIVVMQIVTMMITCCMASKRPNIETDQSALLALKTHISSSSHQILLKNWSSTAPPSSICGWIGVRCGQHHRRVIALNISGMGLTGSIPSHLGNLSFLVDLDLTNNSFHGTLPLELLRLRRIRFVKLSYNDFSGPVPVWLGPKIQILDLRFNHFVGTIPSSISNLSNLEVLNLSGNSLTGKIPEELGNLQRLINMNLQSNHLVGSIPSSIFNVSTLERLALTYNNLTGSLPVDICRRLPNLKGIFLSSNQLSGQIPPSLSQCLQLQVLSLSENNFTGFIPEELGNLEMLTDLALGTNNLRGVIPRQIGNLHNLEHFGIEDNRISGSIPKEIGNLTKLTLLTLTANFLSGSIPEELRNLHNLEIFYTGGNRLNGSIPPGIFNISSLIEFVLVFNYHLTSKLPSNIGNQLPNLEILALGTNTISGVIPASIGNCSRLTLLDVTKNQMTGSIPNSLGNLEVLERLYLSRNYFSNDPNSLEINFLTSLTKCKSLKALELTENSVNGILPNSIGNLSTFLQYFRASRNKITGQIPSTIGNLSSLIIIAMTNNRMTGAIPYTIKELRNLQTLVFDHNNLGGPLDLFCNLVQLSYLDLSWNRISGPVPDCLGNLASLRNLYLGHNLLTSSIPRSIGKLVDLVVLDLSSNSLDGSMPLEMENLKATISINLSVNQISGAIPKNLGDLQNLQNLSLANNHLEGSIPESFGKMLSLTSLDLSHNNLSGLIPKSMEALRSLKVFDVSSNHLTGVIPTGGPFKNFTSRSFINNDALCGDPKFQVPPCKIDKNHRIHVKKMLSLILIPSVIVGLVILALAYVFLRYRRKSEVPSAINVPGVPTKERISYYELLQATNRYSESNLLGSGSFGSVYKGTLSDGKVLAVKVFNLQLEGSLKSFDVECEVFCNLRHRNLVKVISSCSNQDFKALVLEYMPNGSLETWLHSDHLFLNVLQRLNIMIDVASALRYLHQECITPVIHCDLKPSNILIDEDLVAHVSDFGIAKFLGKDESIALTKTFATIGYIAPEYGREGMVSKACDVFSYGILLMEVFTGRRPNDENFGENLSLKSWISALVSDSIVEVIDPKLLQEDGEGSISHELLREFISMIMELALNCVPESPKARLTISEVVDSLKKIKDRYVAYHGGQ